MSPLVLREIFRVFVNTVTSDGNYPVQDCQYLQLPIKMKLSGKQKRFPHFLCDFWNLHQILKFLKKKMIFIANVFPKLQTVKSLVRPLYKKGRFRTRLDTQHVNASQILANSP